MIHPGGDQPKRFRHGLFCTLPVWRGIFSKRSRLTTNGSLLTNILIRPHPYTTISTLFNPLFKPVPTSMDLILWQSDFASSPGCSPRLCSLYSPFFDCSEYI